ncbi:LuxR C-terminal-related transcriptional regulator [Catellatospora coxensis]|uniref:DNA-binding response regulator n=1 Tax=Catellatospora coxensis TaxID=310354 RepID=A0A8J3P9G9_9ACTN|nr:response regulator transcription factor [Catellatospora coxensis]GIG09241.1 DNA-binding response regulator [Catellatospora coxensis]
MLTQASLGATPRIRALISDDNLLVRLGIRSVLETSDRISVIGEAACPAETAGRAVSLAADVIVTSRAVPSGHDAPRPVHRPAVLVVAHSAEQHLVVQALRDGAIGYLVHGQFAAADLVKAVVATAGGHPYMSPGAVAAVVESLRTPASTPEPEPEPEPGPRGLVSRREAELMDNIVRGRTNREIAGRLYITEKTVKNHVNHIYLKLGARTRAEAIAIWLGLADGQPAA